MAEKLIDAYAHVGRPRFGRADEVLDLFDRWRVEKGVLVLGPSIPDLEALLEARDRAGDRIRYMGIPFGDTEERRIELAELQIRMGISGMRVMPFEVHPNPGVLERLGEAGLWLFAINPYDDMPMARKLIDWLEKHPKGRVASPHFLIPQTIDQRTKDPALFRALLSHPRFHAILSRHGGVGSKLPYPHEDLLPWVQEIVEIMGWDRLLWGSEYPVLYWRNEQIDNCRDWILRLGVAMSESDREKYFHANAQRLFFDAPAPECRPGPIPAWVAEQYARNASIPLFPQTPLPIPMEAGAKLLGAYLKKNAADRELTFAQFVTRVLTEKAMELGD